MKSVYYPTVRFNEAGQPVKGEPIFLNARDLKGKSLFKNGDQQNDLDLRFNAAGDTAETATGYQIVTDTLTYIKKQVSEQKNYTVAPADFIPVAVGDGSFAANILTNRTYQVGDDFETGMIRTGVNSARLAGVDVAVDSKTMAVVNWAKAVDYTIFDIEQALVANNWDPIEQKHRARKKNWDLGIQKIAFLGSVNDTRIPGFFNNSVININTARITKFISTMSPSEFATFVQGIVNDYFVNTASTALPTHFTMPYGDWLGMQVLTPGTAGTFPVPLMEYLDRAFKAVCGPNFKIQPNAYCDAANNNTGGFAINKAIYMLHRYDPESVRMDIPVDYTTTQPNSVNNFSFEDVAYGQFTGVGFYRALEALMFRF